MALHCPECGFVNPEGANYCQKCGAYLARPEGEDASTMAYKVGETGEYEPVDVEEEVDKAGAAFVIRSGGGRAGESFAVDSDRTRGQGTVEFPVCYEGPPGIVHGGFLAVFFDCVLQQLNCDLGQAGKTAELSLRFRRPTPLLTQLTVHATREITDGRIRSHAELVLEGKVLCECDMAAAVGDKAALPPVSPRRS